MITITQGDSLAQDINCEDLEVFDVEWDGVWAITKTIGSNPTLQGTLSFSNDYKFLCMRILPAQTAGIPAGKYFLVTRVNNPSTGFSQQIQRQELVIDRRGI